MRRSGGGGFKLRGDGKNGHRVGNVVNRGEIERLREREDGDAEGAALAGVDVGLPDEFASFCESKCRPNPSL